MDLKQIRYFVAVAKERNFTRAAEQLHIAQPALSRQIQLLEQELNVLLLSRESRPLQLTEAGRIFYEQSLQLFNRVEVMKAATTEVGLHQRPQLSIGFVASTLYGGLPILIQKFRHAYPDIRFHFLELTSSQQIAALRAGRIDIAFGRVRIHDSAVCRTVLREERLVLAIPPKIDLAKERGPVSLQVIADHAFIVYPKSPRPSFADHVLNILHDNAIFPTEVHEVLELQTAMGLVAGGVGLCLIPSAAQIRSDLVYRLIDDEKVTSPIIFSHRKNDNSWYIAQMHAFIEEMYAEKPPWLIPGHSALSNGPPPC